MIDPILAAIEAADLAPVAYRAARRLLDRLPPGHDLLQVEAAAACALCGVATWPAARRILAELAAAGVIALHTNSRAYIRFPGRAETARQRAETDHERAETARDAAGDRAETDRQRAEMARGDNADRAETDHERAETDRQRAEMDHSRAISARPLKDLTTKEEVGKEDQPTYLPTWEGSGAPQPPTTPNPAPTPVPAIPAAEQARSLALLQDPAVGAYGKLLALAAAHPFAQIRLQVFQALRQIADPGSRVTSMGVIAHRLQVGAPATVTDQDRASDLWARHLTDQEREAAAAAAAAWDVAPEPDVDPAPEPAPVLTLEQAQWQQLQAEFALQGATGTATDSVIQDAWLIAVDGAIWTIGIADASRYEWVIKKLGKQIQRKLAVITGRPVTLQFQARVNAADVTAPSPRKSKGRRQTPDILGDILGGAR